MAVHLIDRPERIGPAGTVAGTVLGTAAVGAFDVFSGTDVRVLSLYPLPVAWCSWRLGQRGAPGSAGLALVTLGLSQHLSGASHGSAAGRVFNLLSPGVALPVLGGKGRVFAPAAAPAPIIGSAPAEPT